MYSRSSLELRANVSTAYHFFVLKGQAKLIIGSEEKTLGPGEAITCRAEKPTSIENIEKTELSLIQITLQNQLDD